MWTRLRRKILQRRDIGMTVLGVTGAVIALQLSGALQFVEATVLDRWFRLRPLETGESRVVIVTIDESDISRLGRWPLSDATLAKLLDKLQTQQPQAIGLDLYRNLPVEPGHQELLKVFASTPNLFGIQKVLSSSNGAVVDPPSGLLERNQIAASDLVVDADGRVRRHLLSVRDHQGKTSLTLGTKLALAYLAAKNISPENTSKDGVLKLGKAKFVPLQENEGGYVRADVGGYQILANFHRLQGGFPKISVTDVLQDRIPGNLIRGRIVLIGSIAESLSDKFYTPYANNPHTTWPGVELHANLASQILSSALDGRQLLRGLPEPLGWLWIFLWSSVGTALGWNIRAKRWVVIVIPSAIASLIGSAYLLFLAGWWITVVSPFLALVSAGLASRGYLLWRGLQLSHQALENYAQTLELKVQERTHELKEKNVALEKARQDAEAANLTKSQFLANMSHELRTPLNAILGFSQLSVRSPSLPLEHKENLRIITRSGEHLLTLIDQVLDLSKIEAGRTTLNETNFDLFSLLDDLEAMFQLKAKDKHLLLFFERSPDVPQYVRTDEVKLRQVLINLINNALKFTFYGGVWVQVKRGIGEEDTGISLLPTSSHPYSLVFEVKDTGPGIAPDDLNSIFEAFVQTQTGKHSQEGTGLGLPISRFFVQLMGGEITVNSKVGRGTTFKFDIRVNTVNAKDTEIKQPMRRVIALEPNQPCYRILIVDDNPLNRQLLIKLLNPLGFELKEASNGQEAIELWESWKPHLIWMDIRMPVMDGYEATKQIRTTELLQATSPQNTIIVALTATTLEEERAVALSIGCDNFIRKPFREASLFQVMSKHLGVRYVYENSNLAEEKLSELGAIITLSSLPRLSQEWISNMKQAIRIADFDLMENAIEQIRSENVAFAQILQNHLDNFDYQNILNLISNREEGKKLDDFHKSS